MCQDCKFVESLPVHLFEIWTDNNPLIAILYSQTLPEISNKRLQRLKMKVDFLTFTIKWIQGKNNVEADALSGHPCFQPIAEDQLDEGADAIVCVLALDVNVETHTTRVPQVNPPTSRVANSEGVITAVSTYNNANKNSIAFNNARNICVMTLDGGEVTDERKSELRKFANNDDVYKKIADLISKGIPNLKTSKVPPELQPYFKVQQTLHLDAEGFVMNNGKLVVPQSLFNTYLKRLLGMHQGGPKMLARTQQTLWWPHMAFDIGNIAKTISLVNNQSCPILRRSSSHTTQPSSPFSIATRILVKKQVAITSSQLINFQDTQTPMSSGKPAKQDRSLMPWPTLNLFSQSQRKYTQTADPSFSKMENLTLGTKIGESN
jgi:hypothetical protein